MTDPMTDARLDEIERRWRAVGLTSWAAFCDEQEYPNTNIVAFKHRTQLICSIPGADKRDSVPVFIESAIEDVPALVAEVRRLREENERLRSEAGKLEREREAYQRGEQDSRGDPRCPTCRCLRMDVPRSAATCLCGCHPEGGAK